MDPHRPLKHTRVEIKEEQPARSLLNYIFGPTRTRGTIEVTVALFTGRAITFDISSPTSVEKLPELIVQAVTLDESDVEYIWEIVSTEHLHVLADEPTDPDNERLVNLTCLKRAGFDVKSAVEALEKHNNDLRLAVIDLVHGNKGVTFCTIFLAKNILKKRLTDICAQPALISLLIQQLALVASKSQELKLKTLPTSLVQFCKLTCLRLDNNGLSSLGDLDKLTTLQELYLDHNKIKYLPDSLTALQSLRLLSVQHNLISSLPASLGSMRSLNQLHAAHNVITSIPKEFSGLLLLEHLDLSDNKLSSWESELVLPSLRRLNLSRNSLYTFSIVYTPSNPNPFPNLKILELAGNHISELDTTTCNLLGTVDQLDISQNELQVLPIIPNLTSLDAYNNRLKVIPVGINTMTRLHVLNVSNNSLSTLPIEDLAHLSNLQTLILDCNQLTEDTLMELSTLSAIVSSLNELHFAGNGMRSSTGLSYVSKFVHLRELDISNTLIYELPPDLFNPTMHIQSFNASSNHLSSIPPEIANWKRSLIELYLHGNDNLLTLPPSVASLSQLKVFSVANTILQTDSTGAINITSIDTSKPETPLVTLTTLYTSSLHPMLVAAIAQLAISSTHKELKESGTTAALIDLLLQTISLEQSYRRICLVSLVTLSQQAAGRSLLRAEAKLFEALEVVLRSGAPEDIICALDIIANLCHDDSVKTEFLSEPSVRIIRFIEDLEKSSAVPAVRAHARRCLVVLGRYVIPLRLRVPQTESRGYRILTLDGGGTRGFVAVRVLHHIERMCGRLIVDMFDMIAGTSTGSLIAALAIAKRCPMEHVGILYKEFAATMFVPQHAKVTENVVLPPAPSPPPPLSMNVVGAFQQQEAPPLGTDALSSSPLGSAHPSSSAPASTSVSSPTTTKTHPTLKSQLLGSPFEAVKTVTTLLRSKAYYKTEPVEKGLQSYFGKDFRLSDMALHSDVKFVAVSTLSSLEPMVPFLFRNYNLPNNHPSKYLGSSDFMLWQAVRASTAAPGYFDEYTIEQQRFMDGGILHNNPSALALHEASKLWPSLGLELLLSCGTGRTMMKPESSSFSHTITALVHSAAETDKTHSILEDFLPSDSYYRIQPISNAFEMALDDTSPAKFDEVSQAVDEFVTRNPELFQRICSILMRH